MISNSYFRVMDLGSLEKNFRNSILKRDKNNFSYYMRKSTNDQTSKLGISL